MKQNTVERNDGCGHHISIAYFNFPTKVLVGGTLQFTHKMTDDLCKILLSVAYIGLTHGGWQKTQNTRLIPARLTWAVSWLPKFHY